MKKIIRFFKKLWNSKRLVDFIDKTPIPLTPEQECRKNIEEYIAEHGDIMVCSFCLSNCGQCGNRPGQGDTKLSELMETENFKQGWTSLMSNHFFNKKQQ